MKKILDFTVKENRRLNADNFLLVLHSVELPENLGRTIRQCQSRPFPFYFFTPADIRA